ncbi:MAG: glycosyltransferase family 2 protein [Lachnospiraceae bacterium]|nr:glycosyltransferase family 2 protein [Lachnospiraceae bacterium]
MITLSLCMIVKNEEAVLRRCLDSFRPLADEIVIVDTGSTDATKAIAEEYTDKLFDFAWTGDFSEARNFAFSKCSCDYIYSADADEMIDAENTERFRSLKEAMLPEVEMVQMWYVNRHEFRTTDNFEKDLRPKLYKRLRSFTWIDPVHESVRLDPLVFDSDIEILHLPESSHAGRDFSIFQKQLAAGKKLSAKLMHMYATELMLSGGEKDLAEAAPYFEMLLAQPDASEDARMEAYCILARHAGLTKDHDSFFKWCLKNVIMHPCAEICCELGRHYFEAGDFEEASVWYINALEETEAILSADHGERIPLEMLAHCYEKLAGEHPECRDACLQLAAEYKGRLVSL